MYCKVYHCHFYRCFSIHLLMSDIEIHQSLLKMLSYMRSPLVGADGGMHRYPRDGLPCASVCLTPATCFSISGDRTGPLGAAVAIWVILAATSPDPALRLADALAAAEPVDHVLGYCLVKALPMLLRNEYSGKHGGMWGKEKGQYWFRSTTKIEGKKASQRELWSTRKNPGIPVWSHQKQLWHQAQLKKVKINSMESSKWRANLINRHPPSRWIEIKTKGNEKAFDGEIRLFFCHLLRDGWKPEREALSLRRETARKHQRHLLLTGVSLLQRELPQTERSEKKKMWEWASTGFLLCYLSLLRSEGSHSRPLAPSLPSTLHLCVTVHMSPKQEADRKCDKSSWQIHSMNLYFKYKIEILYFLIHLKPQVSFSSLGVSAMSLVAVFGSL